MQAVTWPGRFGKKRLTILRASARRPHRYRRYRSLTMVATLLLTASIPREPVAGAIGILVLFFFTFNLNLVAGRMFCGWGCPIGQLNRSTDDFVAQRTSRERIKWGALLAGFALLFSISIFHGLWIAVPIMTAAALFLARAWGWSFCRKVCPIGLYYSVVQTRRPLGILFDESRCLDEGACVRACPVELDARNLSAPKSGIGGFAIDGLAENSHCLRCGACVEACEIATSKVGEVALKFGRSAESAELPAMEREPIDPRPQPELPIAGEEAPAPRRRWLHAILLTATAVSIAGYAAVAARRASRYSPAPIAEIRNEPARSIAPRAEPRSIALAIEDRAFAAPIIEARATDRLELINRDAVLHTIHVSSGARSLINTPLLAGSTRRMPAPPAGRYCVRCDLHPDEQAELVVSR